MSLSVSGTKNNAFDWNSPHAEASVTNVMQAYNQNQISRSEPAAGYDTYEEEGQKKKRKRGENWTNEDELLLVQLCQKHRIRLESEDVTLRAKNESWQKLTDEFNEVAKWGARDTKALKGKFKAMKASAKKNAHRMNSATAEDCRAFFRMSVAERQLVQLYSDSSGFSRIAGGIDLAANATESTGSLENTQTYAESVDTDDTELTSQSAPFAQVPSADCGTSMSSAHLKLPAKINADLRSALPHKTLVTPCQNSTDCRPPRAAGCSGIASFAVSQPTEVSQAVASISESQPPLISSVPSSVPEPEQHSIAQLQDQVLLKQWELLSKQDTLLAKQLRVTNLQLQYMTRRK